MWTFRSSHHKKHTDREGKGDGGGEGGREREGEEGARGESWKTGHIPTRDTLMLIR